MGYADLAVFQRRKTRDNDAQKSAESLEMTIRPGN